MASGESSRCVMRSARDSISAVGKAPDPISEADTTTSIVNSATEAVGEIFARSRRGDLQLGGRAPKLSECRQIRRNVAAAQVEPERRFERRQRELVAAQRALERIGLEAIDQIAPPDDQSRLRTAEQLVARKRYEAGPGRDAVGDDRLARHAISRQIDQRAGAEIFHHGNPSAFRSRPFRARLTSAVKPIIAVVRRMHLEQHAVSGPIAAA